MKHSVLFGNLYFRFLYLVKKNVEIHCFEPQNFSVSRFYQNKFSDEGLFSNDQLLRDNVIKHYYI